MLISECMTANPLCVHPDDTLRTAIDQIALVGRHLPVVDEKGKLIGIVSDRDLRLAVNSPLVMRERWQDEMLLSQTQVSAIMSSPVTTIEPDVWVDKAAELMLENEISALPVVDNAGKLLGIVTVSDLLRALIHTVEKQLITQQDD